MSRATALPSSGRGTLLPLENRGIAYAAVYVGLVAFYALTLPANHFESLDGYAYADKVESHRLADVQDTRLLLFHAVMRSLYVALNGLGLQLSAYTVMVGVSILSAPAALLLFHRFLSGTLAIAPRAALIGTAFLGASYGFWRYAVEAEVYIPSLLLIIAAISFVFTADRRAREADRVPLLIGPGIFAGLTALFYQPNAIPLFLALPLVFLRRDRLVSLVSYGAFGALTIIGGYVLPFLVSQDAPLSPASLFAWMNNRADEFGALEPIGPMLAVKSLLSLAHDVISTNWVFGHASLTDAVERAMPGRLIEAETYMASKAGILNYVPLIALPVFALAALWCVITAIRNRDLVRPFDRLTLFCLAWFAVFALVVGRLDPNTFEPWIMVLMPLAVLLSIFVFDPCAMALRIVAPTLLIGALLVHNAAAIASLKSDAGDQHQAKNEWLIENTAPEDVVVVPLRDWALESFIQYHVPAQSITIERVGVEATRQRIAEVEAAGGEVFAHDDLFESTAVLAARSAPLAAAVRAWTDDFSARSAVVAENDSGRIYRLDVGAPP